MFSIVSRFFSPVFLIGLGSFLLGFYFLSTIPRSTKLASKEGSNCNHVTFGAKAESFQSRSHVITIIQNFTLVSLAFIIIPYPVGLPFRAMVLSRLLHLITYLTPHCLRSRKVFPAVETICTLPICRGIRLSFLEHH